MKPAARKAREMQKIPEYEVTCVVKDDDGKIIEIGSGARLRWAWSDAIDKIENDKAKFYVEVERPRVYVHVVTSKNGAKHLRTDADGTTKNNLDDLRACRSAS